MLTSPTSMAPTPATPQSRSVQSLEKLATSRSKSTDEKLAIVAQEFEQIIFRQMFRSIQKSSFGQGFFDESGSHSQYSEIALQQLSDTMAGTASLGIADSLHAQLLIDQANASQAQTGLNH